jgi:hypothetical protein
VTSASPDCFSSHKDRAVRSTICTLVTKMLTAQFAVDIDLLLKDMGLRLGSSFFAQFSLPVPQDYEYIAEAKRKRDAKIRWQVAGTAVTKTVTSLVKG